jgi:AcrR family transcriptional regulator
LGISTKTVYTHFWNKEDLLKHCLLLHYSELEKQFLNLGIETKNPVAAICELWYNAIDLDFGVNQVFYHDLNYYYPQLQDAVLRKFFKRNFSKIQHIVVSGIKEGYFRDDLVAEVIPEVISVLYSSITRTGQFKKFKLSAAQLMHNTIDAYLRGVCTDKGLKEIKKNNKS